MQEDGYFGSYVKSGNFFDTVLLLFKTNLLATYIYCKPDRKKLSIVGFLTVLKWIVSDNLPAV